MRRLGGHAAGLGVDRVGAQVTDPGSRAFAERFGFEEIDRQVEQVRALGTEPAPSPVPDGIEVVTVADRPELLEEAYPLACEGWADFATAEPVVLSLEDWLREEATLPEGSFVALRGRRDRRLGRALPPRRRRRRRERADRRAPRLPAARACVRAQAARALAWAAANGYREVVTWTQRGNEGMRAVNERLGYAYRDVSVTMAAPLPLVVARSRSAGLVAVKASALYGNAVTRSRIR